MRRTTSHAAATANTTSPAFGTSPHALSVKVSLTKSLTVPPGASRMTSAKPWQVIMVPSVAAIDCSRRTATKKPFTAPTRPPTTMHRIRLPTAPAGPSIG